MLGWRVVQVKVVDMHNWKRKEHYSFFKEYDYPHFNLCANVDMTAFYRYIKDKELPFFISIVYATSRIANEIKEFRYRIQGEQVVEHEYVNPAVTIMSDEEVFNFCTIPYIASFHDFLQVGLKTIDEAKKNISIADEPDRDDLIFMTSLPWVSFTSIMHPIHMNPVDSVPRIAWGKYFKDQDKVMLPLSIQAHHALMDGVHAGRYYEQIQVLMNNPEKYLK